MSEKIESITSPQENKEVIPNSKVGLSLSFCVSDILRGSVKEEEVKEIIAGINASPEQWDEVIKQYRETYWSDSPDEGEAIARRLYEAGKIKQPRQEGVLEHNIASGHWVDADKIDEWKKEQESKQ